MGSVRQITAEDTGGAEELFGRYPYKTAQRVIQKMDRDKLNGLYINGLHGALKSGHPHWLVERQPGRPLALAGLVPDSWHSQVFGMKIGKIQPWLNTVSPEVGAEMIDTVLAKARKEEFEYLSIRIDGEDFRNLHLMERAGFRLIDVSLKFSRSMPFAPDIVPASREGWSIRLSAPDDVDWMARLGSESHTGTHYLNDPALPHEKTRELFRQWVRRCAEKLAYRIYVLERGGSPVGFVIYLRNNALKNAVGVNPIILDYVILDPVARGGGVGPWFVQETLKRENESWFDFCELRTSTHNLPAMNLYEKTGFRVCSTDFVLSKTLKD